MQPLARKKAKWEMGLATAFLFLLPAAFTIRDHFLFQK
jgi:hypothetical protein